MKKLAAALLAVIMLVSLFPTAALAEELTEATATAKVVSGEQTTYYDSFATACNNAPEGSTVTLLKDVTGIQKKNSGQNYIDIQHSCTVDLGTHKANGADVIYVSNGATVHVKNGTIEAENGSSCLGVHSNGTLYAENVTLSGFNAFFATGGDTYFGSGVVCSATSLYSSNGNGKLHISAGTYSFTKLDCAGTAPSNRSLFVTGGCFKNDSSTSKMAPFYDGYTTQNCAHGKTGYFDVIAPKEIVAKVEIDGKTTEYASFVTACNDAPAGSTITLLKNVEGIQKNSIELLISCTIDLGGHTIKGDDVIYVSDGATLMVKNGTIESETNCSCLGVHGSGTLYAENVTLSGFNAFYATGGDTYLGSGVVCSATSLYSSNGNGRLHITDGDYTCTVLDCVKNMPDTDKVFLTGGCFSYDKSALQNYCMTGYSVADACTHTPSEDHNGHHDVVIPTENIVAELHHKVIVGTTQKDIVMSFCRVQDAIKAAVAGDTVKLVKDEIKEKPISIAGDDVITLDLNGKKLDLDESHIVTNGSLTITDTSEAKTGTITNGKAPDEGSCGGAIYVTGDNASLTLEGGTITGCSAEKGGAVYIDTGRTFAMNGGTIQSNTASANGGGVYVPDTAVFAFNGGSITGNKATDSYGGGVFTTGTMTAKGSGTITGNTTGSTTTTGSNLAVLTGHPITLDSFAGTIGVSVIVNNDGYTLSTGKFTANGTESDVSCFTSDTVDYDVAFNSGSYLELITHVHTWQYSSSGATITATCKKTGCTIEQTLTLSAPTTEPLLYTGETHNATLDKESFTDLSSLPTITYQYMAPGSTSYTSTDSTVAVGNYTASITAGTGDGAKTVSVDFTIQKAPLTFSVTDNSKQYQEGTSQTATVTNTENILSQDETGFTVTYKNSSGEPVESPTAAGTYDIYVTLKGTAAQNCRFADNATAKTEKVGVLVIYETTVPTQYTASFDNDVANMTGYYAGSILVLPAGPSTTPAGQVFTGWQTEDGRLYQAGESFTIQKDTAFTAQFAAAHSISGIVKQGSTKDTAAPLPKAQVILMEGSKVLETVTSNADGKYTFTQTVPNGTYQVIASYDGVKRAAAVTIDGESATQDIFLPSGSENTDVIVADGTPAIVVDNLESVFDNNSMVFTKDDENTVTNGGTVEFRLTAASKDTDIFADTADAETKAIANTLTASGSTDNEKIGTVLDLTLKKLVTPASGTTTSTTVREVSNLIAVEIPIPASLQSLADNQEYVVYRAHTEDDVGTITVETLRSTPNGDGEYIKNDEGNISLTLYVNKFSTYVLSYMTVSSTHHTKARSITVSPADNGTVKSSARNASKGRTITLTVTPEAGYAVDAVTVKTASGTAVAVTQKSDSTYTFTMPGSKVTVSASFVQKEGSATVCPQDETCVYARFTDADPMEWYHPGVHFCVEKGYMVGTEKTLFEPEGTLSRGMIVTMLWRMAGSPVSDYAMSFSDVEADLWYTEAIRWGQEAGVVKGYKSNIFGPNNSVTREQLAAILMRYADWKGVDVSERAALDNYTDALSVSDWATENLRWAAAVGIVTGRTETTLSPTGNATRAEAANMVQRFCETILK